MDRHTYQRTTAALTAWAEHEPDVLALVAIGSTARQNRQPDQWSDHDLLVVTRPGTADRIRNDPAWLPNPDRIVLCFTEPDHGLTVIYAHGHMIELAVCDAGDTGWLGTQDRRALFGSDEPDQPHGAVADTPPSVAIDIPTHDLYNRFVKHTLIATSRLGRGELCSARHHLHGVALPLLLHAIVRLRPPDQPQLLDPLDPTRRIEHAYPGLAAQLDACLEASTPTAIDGLLRIAAEQVAGHTTGTPVEAIDAVRSVLDRTADPDGPGGPVR